MTFGDFLISILNNFAPFVYREKAIKSFFVGSENTWWNNLLDKIELLRIN